MENNIILEGKSISKFFGGVKALQNVDFQLKKGEILSVMGENGAGKSTLMKIIAGVHRTDTGELLFVEKKSVSGHQSRRRKRVFPLYIRNLISSLICLFLENLFMGHEIVNKSGIQWTEMYTQAIEALKLVDLDESILSLPMGKLSIGTQQLVLIARGVFRKCKVLILDEPTSILSYAESEKLFQIMFDLKKKGVSILYISHRILKFYGSRMKSSF